MWGVGGEQWGGPGPSQKQNNNNSGRTLEPGRPGAWTMSRENSQQRGVCFWQISHSNITEFLWLPFSACPRWLPPPPPQGRLRARMEPSLRLLVRVVGWDLEASGSPYPMAWELRVDCPSSTPIHIEPGCPEMPQAPGKEIKIWYPLQCAGIISVSSTIGSPTEPWASQHGPLLSLGQPPV